MPCSLFHSGNLPAVDQAGVLYVSMACQPLDPPSPPPDGGAPYPRTMWVATSADGGRTFGAPVDTRLPALTAAIAAGRPGLVVALGGSLGEVATTRSEDGGVTWQPPQLLATTPPNSTALVHLAVAGERALLAWGAGGDDWRTSEDGARTWRQRRGGGTGRGSRRQHALGAGALRPGGGGVVQLAAKDLGGDRDLAVARARRSSSARRRSGVGIGED
jgi:hypothetical protein